MMCIPSSCRKRIPRDALYSLHEYRDLIKILTQTTSLISMRFHYLAIFTFQFLLLRNQDLMGEKNNEHKNNNGSINKCRHCKYIQNHFRKVVFKARSAPLPCSNSHSRNFHSSKRTIKTHTSYKEADQEQESDMLVVPEL